ncbi:MULTISPECIES: VirD4-like conjugal transfer protein, CD1115 family [Thermoanaerobacter]|uniref:TRAG family protein n=2 Tax=Thermoanaerobacter TaxID=1754 RepID=B0KAV4_THEP3|nr:MULTISPECIES: type IV secretory system conjugative DNA transfer family protein [Thermoanaerobacter]ABY93725.1 TRAG family protein [Thermoanaerobacter pseudethanolicus ATCC 33223]ADV78687.1 TRAG family protein [Thermoanaerobacter brockii subsp. finnii Ako-1]HBW59559.1 conjugal transfer protein TraG [Thermoanaerobacter sp.]
MRFRIIVAVLILMLDFLFAPFLLIFPLYAKDYGFKEGLPKWEAYIKERPLSGISLLLKKEDIKTTWLWLQPAVFAALISVLFPIYGRRKRKTDELGLPEAAGQGQHGTARWRTEKEISKTFTVWNTNNNPPKGGFVVGFNSSNSKAWLDTGDTHGLVIGATRSGKSRRIILPTIWTLARAGESMIVSDPKGELHSYSFKYLKELGYKVILIDLRNPYRGNQWNPVLEIATKLEIGDYSTASQNAWDIANIITNQQPHIGVDPIWPQSQESLTAALILAVASSAPHEAKHLGSVYEILHRLGADGGELLDKYFRSVPREHPAASAYGVAALSEDRLRSSIFTGTAAQLRLWSDPAVIWLTSDQDHELDAVGKEKAAVFIVIPDERSTRNVLATLYISQAYQALVDLANKNGGRLAQRVNFVLDEFGNLPPIPDFDKKITVAAGRGMRFLLAVQDISQIKAKYRELAQTITGNCAVWVYILTTDLETARIISGKTGQYTIRTESYSSQVKHTDYSHGTTEGLTGRPLLLPDEVLRWPQDRALILQARQNPAILPLPDLSMWPASKDLIPSALEELKKEVMSVPVWIPEIEFLEEEKNEEIDRTNKNLLSKLR